MVHNNIEISKDKITEFYRRWKVTELALFGSVLREDFSPKSDIEVFVTFAEDAHRSLYEWIDMIEELKIFFGREVDLLSKRGIRNSFRRHEILTTREVVYAA